MDLRITPFKIELHFSKEYVFKVEQTYLSDSMEIYTLTYKNRQIQFQSDRPLIRKNGDKKKINWKVIGGKVENENNYERIKEQLESYIRNIEKPPYDWTMHPKNGK
ncbi:MAG: hypothetical protein ABJA90_09405 [Ginsengibacter sp.]